MAGATASTVITMMMRTADEGAFKPLTFTLTLDEAASSATVNGTPEAHGNDRAGPGA